MTFNMLEKNKGDGEKPSSSALEFDRSLVDTNTTMVEVQRSRLQNLLNRVLRGDFREHEDYSFLGSEKRPQFIDAFASVKTEEDQQGHVSDFAPPACKSYVRASQALAVELHAIRRTSRRISDNPKLDDSQQRVEKNGFVCGIKKRWATSLEFSRFARLCRMTMHATFGSTRKGGIDGVLASSAMASISTGRTR